jgi:hypothetical protein
MGLMCWSLHVTAEIVSQLWVRIKVRMQERGRACEQPKKPQEMSSFAEDVSANGF